MKRVRRFLLFASTLTSSFWNEWRLTGRVKWRTAPKILAALLPQCKVERGPGSTWWKRMRGCQRCELYDRRRRACGKLGETYERGNVEEPLGCGCFLPLKASSPSAECWLWERTDGEMGVDWAKMLDVAWPRAQIAPRRTLKEAQNA
jgi:hypothetical protein